MPAMPDRTHKYRKITCQMCGIEFCAPGGNTRYCPTCKPKAKKSNAAKRNDMRRERAFIERERRAKRNENLAEAARKCKKLGVSYGEAIARGLI